MPDTIQSQLGWAIKGLGGAVNLTRMHIEDGPPPDPARLEMLAEQMAGMCSLYAQACRKYDAIQRQHNLPAIKHAGNLANNLAAALITGYTEPVDQADNGQPTSQATGEPVGQSEPIAGRSG